jgi:hypothetical protein
MESEQIRTNNEHYSLGMAEGEAIASYELSKMNIIQFLQWKKKTVK